MLILLVGPKGAGKSHVGRLLTREFGVHFLHVETHWAAWAEECRRAGREPSIAGGIAYVHPFVSRALEEHPRVCVETTGASAEILEDLRSLAPPDVTLLVRVSAGLETCERRIATRDPTHHLPIDPEVVRRAHAASEALDLPFALELENEGLAEAEIVAAFAPFFGSASSNRSS
jgi:hypothetical protein